MTAPRISILNARVIDPKSGLDQHSDLHLANGKIVALGTSPNGFVADQILDAQGCIACPGLIDLSARLREPGDEQTATIASETRAAAAGGITTLCCPPDTTLIIDTPAVAQLITDRAAASGYARVLPIGALTHQLQGEVLSAMAALRHAGCHLLGQAGLPFASSNVQRRAFEYAATYDIPIVIEPLDHGLVADGCIHEGAVCARFGLPGIPVAAETLALTRSIEIATITGAHVHFHGISAARSVDMLAEARAHGLAVTADTSIHQLWLTEEATDGFNTNAHVMPPFRSVEDRRALRQAVADGIIQAICSDHQPLQSDAKLAAFPDSVPGISGLETLLSLALMLATEEKWSLADMLAKLTSQPAHILRMPLGQFSIDADADICIFDPHQQWTPSADTLYTHGLNTPFLNTQLTGKVKWTILGGCIVHAPEQ